MEYPSRLKVSVKYILAPKELPEVVADPGDARVVLVIDDDPNALDLMSRALRDVSLEVVTARDGETALHLARTLLPAAITLDVLMPGMDGWEVLRELKDDPKTRDIPVFMVTMTDDRELGYALGATEFLTKPVLRLLGDCTLKVVYLESMISVGFISGLALLYSWLA